MPPSPLAMTLTAATGDPQVRQVAWMTERAADAVALTDHRGVIEYVNPAFERLTGFSAEEAIGRTPRLLRSGQHSGEFYDQLWHTVHGGEEFRGVLVNRRKNGDVYHEEKSIRPLFDEHGRIAHFLSSGRDVTERMRKVAALAYAATHDELTGLAQRSLLDERIEQALSPGRRDGDRVAVALIDVDHFKQINDEMGHAAGDEVLQEVARRLTRSVRETDLVARLGGDEFAVVLCGITDHRALALGLDKIAQSFAAPVRTCAGSMRVTLSIGACLSGAGADSGAALLAQADRAMYRVKHAGGDGSSVHEASEGAAQPASRGAGPVIPPSHPLAEVLILLARHVRLLRRPLRRGEALFQVGQQFHSLYVLAAGAVKLVGRGLDGEEIMLGLRTRGDWLGLEGIGSRSHGCDAVALETGEAWAVCYKSLRSAARSHPLLADALQRALSQEITRERDHALSMQRLPVAARVANFLLGWAETLAERGLRADRIQIPVRRTDIAGHLGVSHESVSRAFSELLRLGLITTEGGRRGSLLVDRVALAAYVRAAGNAAR